MLKHKKLIFLLPFFLFSCAQPNEPYPIKTEPTDLAHHLEITGALNKTVYQSGDKLELTGLTIKVNDEIKDVNNPAKKADILTSNNFYVCTSNKLPTNSVVNNLQMTTNVESNALTFYIAATLKEEGKDTYVTYISSQYKVTINNNNAIKPWVWFVVTGVVIFAVVAMVFFTKRYKAKRDGQ